MQHAHEIDILYGTVMFYRRDLAVVEERITGTEQRRQEAEERASATKKRAEETEAWAQAEHMTAEKKKSLLSQAMEVVQAAEGRMADLKS